MWSVVWLAVCSVWSVVWLAVCSVWSVVWLAVMSGLLNTYIYMLPWALLSGSVCGGIPDHRPKVNRPQTYVTQLCSPVFTVGGGGKRYEQLAQQCLDTSMYLYIAFRDREHEVVFVG